MQFATTLAASASLNLMMTVIVNNADPRWRNVADRVSFIYPLHILHLLHVLVGLDLIHQTQGVHVTTESAENEAKN